VFKKFGDYDCDWRMTDGTGIRGGPKTKWLDDVKKNRAHRHKEDIFDTSLKSMSSGSVFVSSN